MVSMHELIIYPIFIYWSDHHQSKPLVNNEKKKKNKTKQERLAVFDWLSSYAVSGAVLYPVRDNTGRRKLSDKKKQLPESTNNKKATKFSLSVFTGS